MYCHTQAIKPNKEGKLNPRLFVSRMLLTLPWHFKNMIISSFLKKTN
uniref:Uncharacterized protein n=1 Tax=Arundo donax TaxID=35708 RepID=A0A0A9SZD7_ARUDO